MAPMQARWSNWLLFALFLGGAWLFYDIVARWLLPVVTGGFTATVFLGLEGRVERRLGGRRRLAAVLATLAVLLAILLPLAFLAGLVTEEAIGILSYARGHLGVHGLSELWSGRVPEPLARALQDVVGWTGLSETQVASAIAALRDRLVTAASGAFAFTSRTLLDAVLFCLAMYYTFADGRRGLEELIQLVPLEERHAREFSAAFRDVAGAVLFGMTSLALLHGIAGGIGYSIAGAPHPLVLAALQVGFAFVPVVGTAVLWIPTGLLLLAMGHIPGGIFLLVYMGVVSLALEQGVRPQLMRGRLSLHPFLLLLSVLGGVTAFGLAGFLVGPLVVSLLTAVVRIYRRDFVGAPPLRAAG